jgi:hypothetical protein
MQKSGMTQYDGPHTTEWHDGRVKERVNYLISKAEWLKLK